MVQQNISLSPRSHLEGRTSNSGGRIDAGTGSSAAEGAEEEAGGGVLVAAGASFLSFRDQSSRRISDGGFFRSLAFAVATCSPARMASQNTPSAPAPGSTLQLIS